MTRKADDIRQMLERLARKDRFSGNEMYLGIQPFFESYVAGVPAIKDRLSESNYKYVMTSLARNVYLIELVNNDISSTKMEVRWAVKPSSGKKQERFDDSDPRFASYLENPTLANAVKTSSGCKLIPFIFITS
mgnify:CR=1 FL=1